MLLKTQARFWLIGLVVFMALVWLLKPMLLPFVMGMVIAYLLDPLVDRLERLNLPRTAATFAALLVFLGVFAAFIAILYPFLKTQVQGLMEALPGYAINLQTTVQPWVEQFQNQMQDPLAISNQGFQAQDQFQKIQELAGSYAGEFLGWAGSLLKGIWNSGLAVFDILSLLLITPVVAFYLLKDWNLVVRKMDMFLPRQQAPVIRSLVLEAHQTLAGYMRGQAGVCLILGLFYGIGLTIAGLKFGLTIGLLAGVLSFIPYVGTLFGFVSSTALALVQFDSWGRVALVVGIFAFGQFVEGNFLAPKLVGSRVGLHPVWVIFALLAGASLFGFVGVLLAVPVAAVIGVLVRFGLKQYMASRYYTGNAGAA